MPDRAGAPVRSPGRPVPAAAPPRGRARHRWQGASRELAARWDILAVIALGGALGSLGRWVLASALPHPATGFPWATFITNVTGSLALGGLMVLAGTWPPSRYLSPFLAIGVLGGYTTFSAYMLDTRTLLITGHAATAGAYLAGTLAAGLAAVWAGVVAARSVIRLARWRARRQADSERPGGGRPVPDPAAPASAAQPPRSP